MIIIGDAIMTENEKRQILRDISDRIRRQIMIYDRNLDLSSVSDGEIIQAVIDSTGIRDIFIAHNQLNSIDEIVSILGK